MWFFRKQKFVAPIPEPIPEPVPEPTPSPSPEPEPVPEPLDISTKTPADAVRHLLDCVQTAKIELTREFKRVDLTWHLYPGPSIFLHLYDTQCQLSVVGEDKIRWVLSYSAVPEANDMRIRMLKESGEKLFASVFQVK